MDAAGQRSYSTVQRAWEKTQNMSQREILMAARGVSLKPDGPETDKSKKRRAMAGCKDDVFRGEAGYKDEAACNKRVLAGDVSFMLEVMEAGAL